MFPLALLCVVPYHVLGMFCQYWHLSIHTAWSKPGLARSPRSPALYVLHVRVLVTRGRHRAVATEVPVTVPLHAWSGQGQPLVTGPSLVTISSQLVRDPIVIITSLSPAIASSMAKNKAGGRTHIAHMRAFEKLESRVKVSYSLSALEEMLQHRRCRSVCCLISLRHQPQCCVG